MVHSREALTGPRSDRPRLVARAALAFVLAASPSAWSGSTVFDWIPPGGGSFATPENWSPLGGPPTSVDRARFFVASSPATTSVVSFFGDAASDQLEFNATAWRFELGGSSYIVGGEYPCADIGGDLTIADGTLDTQWSLIRGTLALADSTATWQNANAINLVESGHLEIPAGATLFTGWLGIAAQFAPGSSSSLVVTGSGSLVSCPNSVLAVGSVGEGTLLVESGALVNSLWGELGSVPGAHGTAMVIDDGHWGMPQSVTLVGLGGEGQLDIATGGSVSTGFYAGIGEGATADGEVQLDGESAWTIAGDLHVGRHGAGRLHLSTAPSLGDPLVEVDNILAVGSEPTGSGEVELSGAGAQLHAVGYAVVGGAGVGAMELTFGAEFAVDGPLLIGDGPTGAGDVFLDGAYALPSPPVLEVGSYLAVGSSGTGSLVAIVQGHISADACIVAGAAGSVGEIELLDGPDLALSGFLDVGRGGEGSLTMVQSFAATTSLNAGVENGASGAVVVSGGSLTITDGAISLGGDGTGTLHADGGAAIAVLGGPDQIGGLVLLGSGAAADGELVLDGSGTLLDATAQLACGSFGHGAVRIENGAELRSRKSTSPSGSAGIVGLNDGGTGQVTVQSGGQLDCVDGALTVGFRDGSSGSLEVLDGASVNSVGGFIGREAGAAGSVVVQGPSSIWTSGASLSVGELGSGALIVESGGIVEASQIAIGANGTVTGDGTLSGTVINHGVVNPGGPTATLTFTESYTQSPGGRLVLAIGGVQPGDYARLHGDFTGFFDLGGTLEIVLVDGFVPRGGEQLVVLAGGAMLNDFAALEGPVPFEFTAGETIGLLTFLPTCVPADLNCDGTVNGADIGLLLSQWGTANPEADLNGDGVVSGADMGLLLAAWGG